MDDQTQRPSQDIDAVARRILDESTTPQTPGEQRRQSLIEAAYHLIAEKGFEQLRTRDIATRTGVNIATLHYYFARKEDLIQGVVEYLLKQFMLAHLPDSPFEMGNPLEQIRAELAEMHTLLHERPEVFIVMNELSLRSRHDPMIHASLQWLDQGWHTYLEQILRQGKEQHLFRPDLDPERAAAWLILLFKGTTLQFLTNPQSVDFQQIRAEVEYWLTGEHIS